MTTPATSDALLAKAAGSAADIVMIDLEDSVAPSGKLAARQRAIEALNGLPWGKQLRACRVNALSTPWGLLDIDALLENCAESLDIIVLPKIVDHHDVITVERQIEAKIVESGSGPRLQALIEEASAYSDIRRIASVKSLDGVIFGAGDFTASLGVSADAIGFGSTSGNPGGAYQAVRSHIAVMAKAAGKYSIDTPFPDYRDSQGYREEAIYARSVGYEGKWCIHPSQIELANEIFSPSKDQFEMARELVTLYEAHIAEHESSSLSINGKMIDEATARIARRTYDKGLLTGMGEPG